MVRFDLRFRSRPSLNLPPVGPERIGEVVLVVIVPRPRPPRGSLPEAHFLLSFPQRLPPLPGCLCLPSPLPLLEDAELSPDHLEKLRVDDDFAVAVKILLSLEGTHYSAPDPLPLEPTTDRLDHALGEELAKAWRRRGVY